jgi:hypothetical protein
MILRQAQRLVARYCDGGGGALIHKSNCIRSDVMTGCGFRVNYERDGQNLYRVLLNGKLV